MNRKEALDDNSELLNLYQQLEALHSKLDKAFSVQLNRSLPVGDLLRDRWKRAEELGFGEGTNIYDSVLVLGAPKIGKHCWIGPFGILDGSGGLTIGDFTTISAGVHIYTHDNVKATLLPGKFEIERSSVTIGSNCYIAPQSIITRGVVLGNNCIVAANSMLNKSFDDNSIIAGNPAKKIGEVIIADGDIKFNYYNK